MISQDLNLIEGRVTKIKNAVGKPRPFKEDHKNRTCGLEGEASLKDQRGLRPGGLGKAFVFLN